MLGCNWQPGLGLLTFRLEGVILPYKAYAYYNVSCKYEG